MTSDRDLHGKQAEDALAHQRLLYEAVLSTTPDLAYIFDLDHRFIYANEGLLRMWGKTWDEAIGKNCLELGYEPWHAEMHDREIERVVATRQPIRGVVPFTGAFGRRLYDYIFTPVLDANGEVKAVAGTTRDITDIKQNEEALRASEAKYRTLFESIDEGFCIVEVIFDERDKPVDYRFLEINPAFERQTGLTAARGRTMRELSPDHEEHWFETYGRIARTGQAARFEFPAVGLHRWYDVYAWRYGEPDRRQVAILFNDATERKLAEEALREREARLEDELADAKLLQEISTELVREGDVEALYGKIMDAAVAIMGSDFASMQMLHADRGQLRLLGARGFSEEAKEFWKWVGPASGSSCALALQQGKRCMVIDARTDEYLARSGTREAYLQAGILAMQSTPLLSRSGELIGMITTHWHEAHQASERDLRLFDVLARQAADLIERKKADDALRESEDRFRTLANAVPTMIWVSDVTKACTWFNKWWQDFTGRPMQELLGDGWTRDVHPEDLDRCLRVYASHFDARQPFSMEYRLKRHDGQYRWVLDDGIPRFDANGVFAGYLGSCVDLTERRQAEESLREADRRKDEFLAMLSHELRNPLAPIRNAVSLLQEADGEAPVREQARAILDRQVGHLTRLVDDLLDIARISRGGIGLRKEVVRLDDIVADAVETSRPLIADGGHRLEVDLPPAPIWLSADRIRLAQVIANLLNNAARYTPHGGRISLTARADAGTALITVRDNGIGIDPQQLPGVFGMFFQAGNGRQLASGGLGIGLALARQLVELHGGSIEARSEGVGRGSEFTVRVPLPILPALAREPVQPTARESARRVLIADDNMDAAQSLGMLLRKMGHAVRVSYDGATALEDALREPPELVLLDIDMPKLDGFSVASRLREDPRFDSVPIVALTGLGQEVDRRRSRQAGFDHHVLKPVDVSGLREALELIRSKGRQGAPVTGAKPSSQNTAAIHDG